MKKIPLTIVIAFAISFANAQNTTVDISRNSLLVPIKDGELKLSAIPDTITFILPGENPESYTIQFNRDTSKRAFKLGFSLPDGDKNGILLHYNSLDNGKLLVVLQSTSVIGVGGAIVKGKQIEEYSDAKLYIKITSNKTLVKKDDKTTLTIYDSLTTKEPQAYLPDPETLINECFFCDTVVCINCPKPKKTDEKSPPKIVPSHFDYQFLTPSNDNNGNAVTPKYRLFLDTRSNEMHYLKFKGKSGYEYLKVKKVFHPIAGMYLQCFVIGPRDSSFEVNSSTDSKFLDDADNFAKGIQSKAGDMAGEKPAGSPDSAALSKIISPALPPSQNLNAFISSSEQMDLAKNGSTKQKIAALNQSFKAISFAKGIPSKDSAAIVQNNELKSTIDKLYETTTTLYGQLAAAAKEAQQSRHIIDSLIKEIKTVTSEMQSLPGEIEIKKQLLSLEISLEQFNSRYENIDLRQAEYDSAFDCLKIRIKEILHIPVPSTENDFAAVLINKYRSSLNVKHYMEFRNIISNIGAQYNIAATKKSKYKVFIKNIHVPNLNVDDYSIYIRTSKGANNIFGDTVALSLGLKIDFSTGLFANGINAIDYALVSHKYRYAVTQNFATRNPANPGQDSMVYTGEVRDTAGGFIASNRKKFNYSTGILVHLYPRTGRNVDVGATTGVIFNNSDLMLLAGASVMFHVGSMRLAVVGGWVFGKQKALTSDAEQYKVENTNQADGTLFQSAQKLPKFYPGSSITTYDKRQTSWFFGITYNFASKSL